ncbi:hypothetical protein Aab01nite_27320 [Paractinoplanes abujensis]|nr:hypothetical protein Aab01nite_27320 [Actinoplanes abujensis]
MGYDSVPKCTCMTSKRSAWAATHAASHITGGHQRPSRAPGGVGSGNTPIPVPESTFRTYG